MTVLSRIYRIATMDYKDVIVLIDIKEQVK